MMNLQFVAPIVFLVFLKFRRGRFLYTPSYFHYLLIILFLEENIFVRLKIFNSIRKDKKKKNKKDKKTTMNDNLAPNTESRQIMAKKLTRRPVR